jgi:magnesium and cobalt transporter
MKQLGHMPRRGETVVIEGVEFRVARADRRRVDTLKVTMPNSIQAVDQVGAGD